MVVILKLNGSWSEECWKMVMKQMIIRSQANCKTNVNISFWKLNQREQMTMSNLWRREPGKKIVIQLKHLSAINSSRESRMWRNHAKFALNLHFHVPCAEEVWFLARFFWHQFCYQMHCQSSLWQPLHSSGNLLQH